MNLRRLKNLKHLFIACLATSVFPVAIFSATPTPNYPPTLKIPVTFYDFHSDSSNPEFEITPTPAGRKVGMVATSLDRNAKPTVGATPYFNYRIDRWFRAWAPGDDSIYNYGTAYPARYTRYNTYPDGMIHLPYDTSFKNIVFHDTLVFSLINATTGTYQFSDDTFFPLDGKGFGNEGRDHNYSFAMELHYPFTKIAGLNFSFTGDDDVWVFVDSTLEMDLGGIHGPVSGDLSIDRIPELVDNFTYNLDFFYVERHVTGSNILITTNIISPPVVFKLNISPSDTTCAGEPVTFNAIVTDNYSGARPDLAQTVQWRVLKWGGQPDTALRQSVGQSVTFVPKYAYSDVTIEGSLFDGTKIQRDTVTLHVRPCEVAKIWIEATVVDTTDTNALRNPQPLDIITITDNMLSGDAIAVARDKSGAYVRLANPVTTEWVITPDGVAFATATGEPGKKYHGIVTRTGGEGTTYAVAYEPDTTIERDSVPVKIVPYYFVKLQLRDSLGNVVTSINMTTDDYQNYTVWGLKSTNVNEPLNPASWEKANVKWSLNGVVKVKIPPPTQANNWLFDPITPGTDTLTLVNTSDPRTEILKVPMIIVRAAADSLLIKLISNPPLIAGDTLLFEVQIRNSDGLVPGTYCFKPGGDDPNKGKYQDILGTGGGKHPWPVLQVDGIGSLLNVAPIPTSYMVDECFSEGLDTVKVVLYYAPYSTVTDSMHRISVSFGALNAQSDRFRLQPSVVDSIGIENKDFTPIPPQTLTNSESVTPWSDGYDRFGNRIGMIETNWNSTGTLTPIHDSNTQNTYVTAEGVTTDQQGNVCSTIPKPGVTDGSMIQACLPVKIIGPRKKVTSAISRDLNGNGFLDAIEIHFDRVVAPSEITLNNFKKICYGTTCFDNLLTGITPIPNDSLAYLLTFDEDSTPNVSQTYWQLSFDISGTLTISETERIVTTDGAGPVIWTITKDIASEIVQITLSERVKNISGGKLEVNVPPPTVFNVYSKNSNNTYTLLPTMLDSILVFDKILYDSVLIFKMSNGEDLSQIHWMNLKTNPTVVRDNPSNAIPNVPHPDNVKRRVVLVNQKDDLKVAPNPTRADFSHVPPGVLTLASSENHVTWARNKEGVLIQVVFTPPSDGSPVAITMKFYDLVGNLVNWVHTDDIMRDLRNSTINQIQDTSFSANLNTASVLILKHYWNGSSKEGMKVAPGLYRVVYTIDYSSTSGKTDQKHIKLIGIEKSGHQIW